jgi:hypothetical protein
MHITSADCRLAGLPPVGLPRGLHPLQDHAYSNLWGGYTFAVEEINAGCSALLVCSRAIRNVHHRQGIPYRAADREGRSDAVVEVRVGERGLLHNHGT